MTVRTVQTVRRAAMLGGMLAVWVSGCELDRVTLGGGWTDGGVNAYQCSCLCEDAPLSTEVGVMASADDAEELLSSGAVDLVSTDLELTEESGPQLVGLRFQNLGIPHGALITSASLQLVADEVSSTATSLVIQAEASDNAAAFTTSPADLSLRARTVASAGWVPGPWNVVGEAGPAQQTPDLTALLQEVVDRPGFGVDSAVVLLISGAGHRVAASFDRGEGLTPRLHLEYQQPPVEVALNACVPPNLNTNRGGRSPTEELLVTDCEERVEATVRGLAGACGYPATCQCAVEPLTEPMFAATCDQDCVGEPVAADCSNFNPEVDGGVTATHAGADAPVCITSSPLSAGMFGQQSACEVTGTATLVAAEETKSTAAAGRMEFSGGPCLGEACAVGLRYRMALAPVTYETLFASATFEDLSGVGHSLHGAEALLSPTGAGLFAPGATQNSARGRRGADERGLVGTNGEEVGFTVLGGDAPSCSLSGALVGAVDPELKRCEAAGPSQNQLCTEDADCVDHEDCTGGFCDCLPVVSADVTLSLAVSGPLVNQPPRANAGADQTVECNLPGQARLALASTLSDPDGNIAQVRWHQGSRTGPVVGAAPSAWVEQAVGTVRPYVVRVIDTFAQADEDATEVSVVDTVAPLLECNAPAQLSPPEAPLAFTASATDVCDAAVVPEITSARCFRINPDGRELDSTHACQLQVSGNTLRLKKSLGVGNRIQWTLRAFDDAGNVATRTCELKVVRP